MEPNTLNPVTLLVVGLAGFRLTRLVVRDSVWAATRARIRNWLRAHATMLEPIVDSADAAGKSRPVRYTWKGLLPGKIADASACSQCAGVWVTAATAAGWQYGGDAVRWLIVVAALCGVQSIAALRTGG